MPAAAIEPPGDAWAPTEAETVALAYLRESGQDRWAALVRLAQDALADLDQAEALIRERGRQISHGYVRAAPRSSPLADGAPGAGQAARGRHPIGAVTGAGDVMPR